MGDHDYGTHDFGCADCLGYAIGYRAALREAAADLYSDDGPGNLLSTATWLRARALTEETP